MSIFNQGVGVSTLYPRRQELWLPSKYSNISDARLDDMVRDIKSQAPESLGTAMVLGHLKARGVNLANGRRRVGDSLRRLDPHQAKARWNTTIKRRLYTVKGKEFDFVNIHKF